MADALQEIEDRLYRLRDPNDWSVNEGFEPHDPLTLKELARMVETVVEAVQTLRSEAESHAQLEHHNPAPW